MESPISTWNPCKCIALEADCGAIRTIAPRKPALPKGKARRFDAVLVFGPASAGVAAAEMAVAGRQTTSILCIVATTSSTTGAKRSEGKSKITHPRYASAP
jgi:hypothetical protein